MSTAEMLEAFAGLTLTDRLACLEAALHTMREEASVRQSSNDSDGSVADVRRRMAEAAELLLADYADEGGELTALTDLDGEPFYATR